MFISNTGCPTNTLIALQIAPNQVLVYLSEIMYFVFEPLPFLEVCLDFESSNSFFHLVNKDLANDLTLSLPLAFLNLFTVWKSLDFWGKKVFYTEP